MALNFQKPAEAPSNINMILWGEPGTGKTTLASTLPGRKLWLSFDQGAVDAVADRDDIEELALYEESDEIANQLRNKRSMFYSELSKNVDRFDGLVFDSTTMYLQKIFKFAIDEALKLPLVKNSAEKPTDLAPGFAGYGAQNRIIVETIEAFQYFCASHKKHCVMIMHENVAEKDDKGKVTKITIMLGANMIQRIAPRFGEIWYMYNSSTYKVSSDGVDRGRFIIVRNNYRLRSPIKTRILDNEEPEFTWVYDIKNNRGMTLEAIYKRWQEGGKKKIPVPVEKEYL